MIKNRVIFIRKVLWNKNPCCIDSILLLKVHNKHEPSQGVAYDKYLLSSQVHSLVIRGRFDEWSFWAWLGSSTCLWASWLFICVEQTWAGWRGRMEPLPCCLSPASRLAWAYLLMAVVEVQEKRTPIWQVLSFLLLVKQLLAFPWPKQVTGPPPPPHYRVSPRYTQQTVAVFYCCPTKYSKT